MTTNITTVEADGQFYVNVSLDGHDKQYGPYSTADEAEIMAARMGAICRILSRRLHGAAGGPAGGTWRSRYSLAPANPFWRHAS